MNDAPGTPDREAPGARRFVSPALFAVVAICFFLPFVTIACNQSAQGLTEGLGEELGATPPAGSTEELEETFTGWQLVTGDTEEEAAAPPAEGLPGQQPTGQVKDSQPLAIASLAAAVLGIALSWLALWIGPIAGAALGIAGVILLFMLKGKVEGIIPGAQFQAFIEFRWEIGFWIAMAGFGLAAAWSIYRLLSEARLATRRAGAGPAPPPPAAGEPDVTRPPERPTL